MEQNNQLNESDLISKEYEFVDEAVFNEKMNGNVFAPLVGRYSSEGI